MKWLFAAALLLLSLGNAVAQPPPGPPGYAPIPPPRYERMPPPPGEHFFWEPGHWHWDGVRYAWIVGHYVERHRGGHWVEGGWVWAPREGRWVWRPARWD